MADGVFRMTSQREVILRELRSVTSHPTADEIYLRVRKVLPRISLGTVYRNLEVLSEMGLVLKLEYGGSQRRYDGNPERHHHIRCVECGKVGDVVSGAVPGFTVVPELIAGFRVIDAQVLVVGVCDECAARGLDSGSGGIVRGKRME